MGREGPGPDRGQPVRGPLRSHPGHGCSPGPGPGPGGLDNNPFLYLNQNYSLTTFSLLSGCSGSNRIPGFQEQSTRKEIDFSRMVMLSILKGGRPGQPGWPNLLRFSWANIPRGIDNLAPLFHPDCDSRLPRRCGPCSFLRRSVQKTVFRACSPV